MSTELHIGVKLIRAMHVKTDPFQELWLLSAFIFRWCRVEKGFRINLKWEVDEYSTITLQARKFMQIRSYLLRTYFCARFPVDCFFMQCWLCQCPFCWHLCTISYQHQWI